MRKGKRWSRERGKKRGERGERKGKGKENQEKKR